MLMSECASVFFFRILFIFPFQSFFCCKIDRKPAAIFFWTTFKQCGVNRCLKKKQLGCGMGCDWVPFAFFGIFFDGVDCLGMFQWHQIGEKAKQFVTILKAESETD